METKPHQTKSETSNLDHSESSYISSLSKNIQHNLMSEDTTPRNKRRVMLVEDNIPSQLVAKNILEQLSCEVDIAENAGEALKLDERTQFDIIFLDIDLPDLDGISLCRIIRGRPGKNQFSPIVALSSRASEKEKPVCIAAGMNAYMEKPAFRTHFEQIMNLHIAASV